MCRLIAHDSFSVALKAAQTRSFFHIALMELKSKSVRLFCAVVESGSLLAAADKIALSASAASRVISQLEERLGFTLFSIPDSVIEKRYFALRYSLATAPT